MESSTDSYLHKKFKKQLTIESRPQNNDKENKEASKSESNEEKRQAEENVCNPIIENQTLPDNNESVPNQSTNHSSSFTTSVQNINFSTSSISVENSQLLNQCISYVVSTNHLNERLPASFDTKFSEQPTNFVSSTSSILDNYYPSRPNFATEDPYSYDYTVKQDEPVDGKLEVSVSEVTPPPDKNSGGKYVCPYCSMVCSKPSVLQKHIRAHTNERPYPCKSCGFSFKTRSNLYKHNRSRTHANRVMGNKMQDSIGESLDHQRITDATTYVLDSREEQLSTQKPYKPRFHTAKEFFENVAKENIEDEQTNHTKHPASVMLSHHINEIISKNNSIVNSNETLMKKQSSEDAISNNESRFYRMEAVPVSVSELKLIEDQPLNLTNKNRKRAMSEVSEPVIQKSLIKELLLKNLSSSDMQCPYCKMIFQTVTELDVHKYRNCKGKPSGIKYTRSSSVNVASILTQNKNAFDNIPQLHNAVFPLNSPGPFLGKTRLVESDKNKSFSFDNGNLPLISPSETSPNLFCSSPLSFEKEKKPIKFFGGEVKVQSSGETKSYKMDGNNDKFEPESNYIEYGGKLSENRVVKSSLQSGGTVLTSKTNFTKQDLKAPQEVIRVYENSAISPSIDISNFTKQKFTFERPQECITSDAIRSKRETNEIQKTYPESSNPLYKYTNIMDFSQKAVKMLTPNIRQPNLNVSNIVMVGKSVFNKTTVENAPQLNLNNSKPKTDLPDIVSTTTEVQFSPKKQILPPERNFFFEPKPLYNPLNLLVNGKVVRHVPGMPGPVVASENPEEIAYSSNIVAVGRSNTQDVAPKSPIVPITPKIVNNFIQRENVNERLSSPNVEVRTSEIISRVPELKPHVRITESKPVEAKATESEIKKFARPNSLALKPTTAALKQHHGLTPTMFNQILISPDTPRVAKKYAEHFLHGNYFSYLGLKSSTRPVYCTLNKTQPYYVPHFKKLSMYSEWRQQDTKVDKLYVSNYDSRQKNQSYTVAGKTTANLIIHSSYKFIVSEIPTKSEKEDNQKNMLPGGYECNDDYTYIRGRGRGRYVCDQCGIRCKKPSMLKKHIRTHSNDRPYTCSHCNFSFKTKGNLTKHMKSKAHTKNYTASGGSSSSTQQSEHSPHSSDSDSEDSGMDSSDESTRQQEHEAAYGLLSLSQKPTQGSMGPSSDLPHLSTASATDFSISSEEVAYVSKTNYAKNKFLDERNSLNFTSKKLNEVPVVVTVEETTEARNVNNFLGKCNINRPLTYPYTMVLPLEKEMLPSPKAPDIVNRVSNPISVDVSNNIEVRQEPKSIKQFHVIQKYMPQTQLSPKIVEKSSLSPKKTEPSPPISEKVILNNKRNLSPINDRSLPTLKLNDMVIVNENVSDLRKRKFPVVESSYKNKMQRNDEVMDLSMPTTQEKQMNGVEERLFNNNRLMDTPPKNVANEIYNTLHKVASNSPPKFDVNEDKDENFSHKASEPSTHNNGTVIILRPLQEEPININYTMEHQNNDSKISEYDNSAMETLADVATKQVKLEKNSLAKNVATEFLKLATKNENLDGCMDSGKFGPINKDISDLIVKSEGNKSCTICAKSFNKPSQLRLHMNIHYLERPFRCESCSVSFRTKGHLQKHERSASHHNKLSSSPALSSSEPRPFKCSDCNIAFRIHGHLAKHLRSKMHIMKLECLAKVPFGLYAELERSNSLLTEINTSDGEQCLESLKTLAKKVFTNDPSKLNQLELRDSVNNADC